MSKWFLTVLVLAVFVFQVVNLLHHRTAKKHHIRHRGNHPEKPHVVGGHDVDIMEHNRIGPYNSCLVEGKIFCDGKPAVYLRPYLTSPEYPNQIVSIALSHEDGKFKLATGEFIYFTEPVHLEVRHNCPVEGVEPMDKCAIPYFTTTIVIDHLHKSYIWIDVKLDERIHETAPFCLF